MPRNTRQNSNAPDILPFRDPIRNARVRNVANMADAAGAGAPPVVAAPVVAAPVIWTDNPFTSDFNPGTTVGQKIFLEKMKGLPSGERLALTSGSSRAILDFLKVKEQLMGTAVSAIPTSYPGGVPSDRMNLIYQSP